MGVTNLIRPIRMKHSLPIDSGIAGKRGKPNLQIETVGENVANQICKLKLLRSAMFDLEHYVADVAANVAAAGRCRFYR